ncbi:MAG: PPC domain-containing protein [Elainellaceae cyanobacterium]
MPAPSSFKFWNPSEIVCSVQQFIVSLKSGDRHYQERRFSEKSSERSLQGMLKPVAGVGITALGLTAGWVGLTPQRAIAASYSVQSTTSAGVVRAEYSDDEDEFCSVNPRLRIIRDGEVAFDQELTTEVGFCRQDSEKFEIRDLDGDDEPEVILDFYSGGAHCCWFSQIFDYDPAQGQYVSVEHFWGNMGGFQLDDLDDDGVPEFTSADDRFAYAFTSFAGSAFPPQFWQYRDGEMVDVTREFPDEVYAEAVRLWNRYTSIQDEASNGDLKGVLAAYLATKYLLDQSAEGWNLVRQIYQAGDRDQYFADLQEFLQTNGYALAQQVPAFSPAIGSTSVLLEADGALESGDSVLPSDGSLYDEHPFNGRQGQPVVITLESAEFDTYLVLVSPSGSLISQNDDISDENRNSSITVILPETGTYLAIANAYDSTGQGTYRLTIREIVESAQRVAP